MNGSGGGGEGGLYDHQEEYSTVISCQHPVSESTKRRNKGEFYFGLFATLFGIALLLDTHPGKSAMSYLLNRFTGGRWNERTVRRLLHHRRGWAFQLGRRHVMEQQRRRRIVRESSSSPRNLVGSPPMGMGLVTDAEEEELALWECPRNRAVKLTNSLVLSTTTYRAAPAVLSSADAHEEVDEDEVECSICLVPLEAGDRVGKLPCRHSMHVECLKPWLQRQNACPLCKRLKIAQPRYADKNDDSTRGRRDDMFNTRTTEEGSSSSDNLMQESDEAVHSVQGLESLDPVLQAEDEEESNHQLDGSLTARDNNFESPRQSDRDNGLEDEEDGLSTSP
jgi:Ring finger domain